MCYPVGPHRRAGTAALSSGVAWVFPWAASIEMGGREAEVCGAVRFTSIFGVAFNVIWCYYWLMPKEDVKTTRVNLRIPHDTFQELDRYAMRSGMSRTQFILHGAILGCRALDQMSFPHEYIKAELLEGVTQVVANKFIEQLGGLDEFKKFLAQEMMREE